MLALCECRSICQIISILNVHLPWHRTSWPLCVICQSDTVPDVLVLSLCHVFANTAIDLATCRLLLVQSFANLIPYRSSHFDVAGTQLCRCLLMHCSIIERKNQTRQPKWIENIKEDLDKRKIHFEETKAIVHDRTEWRRVVPASSSFS